jgi:hypothetical protein
MEKGWGSDSAPATPAGTVRPGAGKAPHPDAAAAKPDASSDGWKSVDDMSGPMSGDDWSHTTGNFPDSGVWKQT